ncbi:MAG TPA: CotH kinase family protein [Bacteroidales bacterium]|nr:CotH kinase family protein [Bacteroidales bacterium]HOR60934.1 CotH kinase family protein [Bacteroidales bacterium]
MRVQKCIVSKLFFICIFCQLVFSTLIAQKLTHIDIKTEQIINFEKYVRAEIVIDEEPALCLGGKIRCRGGFSSKFYKHSYRLELDEKYELCGMPEEDDWILNANYIDKTFMRHKISFDLFNQMGDNCLAPNSRYAKLYVNEEYKGIYVVMQFVGAKFVGIDKKDDAAFLFKEPPIFYRPNTYTPVDPNDPYEQKFPKLKDKNITYLAQNLQEFLHNSSDSVFIENVGRIFDLDNIANWHILLLLTNNADGILKNFYLYRRYSNDLIKIAIWDYDHSFGRDGDNEYNMLTNKVDCNKNVLLRRLMELNATGYKRILLDTWNKHRKSGTISYLNILKMIFANHMAISGELKNNFNRWPASSTDYFDDNNYFQEINIIMQYLQIRIPELDLYFKKLAKENR